MAASEPDRIWLSEDSGSDDECFHDARAEQPLSSGNAQSSGSARPCRRDTLYLPALSSASTSTASVSTVGKCVGATGTPAPVSSSATASTSSHAQCEAESSAQINLKHSLAAISLSDSAHNNADEDDDDDDDWEGFISSGYKAFPLPPSKGAQARQHSASRSAVASPRTSFLDMSEQAAAELNFQHPSSSADGTWVSSDEDCEALKSAVTPRADCAVAFPAAQEVPKADLARQDKELPTIPSCAPAFTPATSEEASPIVPKKATLRFSMLNEREASVARHNSVSSASSLLSNRVSRQFSIDESISTRPSTMYGNSDCSHGLEHFAEEHEKSVESDPFKNTSTDTAVHNCGSSTYSYSRADLTSKDSIRSPAGYATQLERVSEADETRPQRQHSSRSSTSLRKAHRKRSGRSSTPTTAAPVAPPRIQSLAVRRHQEERLCRGELGITPGAPSTGKRPLLGRWLEDAAALEQSSPHALFARELFDHLGAEHPLLASRGVSLDLPVGYCGLREQQARPSSQAATQLRDVHSATVDIGGQSRCASKSIRFANDEEAMLATTTTSDPSQKDSLPSRARQARQTSSRKTILADAQSVAYTPSPATRPMRIRLCGYDATITKHEEPALVSDQSSGKVPVLKRLKSMPRVLQTRRKRDAVSSKEMMPPVSSESDAAMNGGPFASSQCLPSPQHVPSSKVPLDRQHIFALRKKPSKCFIEEFSDRSSPSKKSSLTSQRSSKFPRPSLQIDRLAASVSTFKTGNNEDWASCHDTASVQARKSTDATHTLTMTVEENVRRFLGQSDELDCLLETRPPTRLADSLDPSARDYDK